MTENQIRKILNEHKSGGLSLDDALARLRELPFEDLGFANVDHHRTLRQGFPEVVFGSGKTVEQVGRIVEAMNKHDHNILVTRATPLHFERVKQIAPEAEFHEVRPRNSHSERQDDSWKGHCHGRLRRHIGYAGR